MAKGVELRVVFDGETVSLHPDVFLRFRAKVTRRETGARVIPIEEIVAVELVESSLMLNGYVRFTLAPDDDKDADDLAPDDDKDADDDESRRPPAPNSAAAVKRAARDPNAVMFSRYQGAAFTALHDAITAAIAERAPE